MISTPTTISTLERVGCRVLFTYRDYYDLITTISNADIKLFLRHDVDISVKKAVDMAEREYKMGIGPAVYYILVSSEYYNPVEKETRRMIKQILDMGHGIGLHYDLASMPEDDQLRTMIILGQAQLLETSFNTRITSVAAHKPFEGIKPSEVLIEALSFVDLVDPNNRFKDYKYLSDSGMNFREDPYEAIKYHKLIHLNIHPEWWDKKEGNYQDRLFDLDLDQAVKQKIYKEIKSLKIYHETLKRSSDR